jgi:hypothetical protein
MVSGRLGRAVILREKREEPITGTAISLARGDMQVKHNYKTPASWLDCFSAQNGLTTTRSTMAINANVGSSLTIRKNRAECTLLFVLKAARHRASAM